MKRGKSTYIRWTWRETVALGQTVEEEEDVEASDLYACVTWYKMLSNAARNRGEMVEVLQSRSLLSSMLPKVIPLDTESFTYTVLEF